MIYKKDTLFKVCNHVELLLKGWRKEPSGDRYQHDDFSECLLTYAMIDDNQTKILSVVSESLHPKWYFVKENEWKWPVATFLIQKDDHTCIEGITPILGWFICKTCGDNLREIKS